MPPSSGPTRTSPAPSPAPAPPPSTTRCCPLELAGAEIVRRLRPRRASWHRCTPTPPCATPARRPRRRSPSGGWRWRSARTCTRRARLRRDRRGAGPQGRAGSPAGALDARLPSCRPRAGAEQRAELEGLRTRLVELEVAFQRNLNEYHDWIEVDRDGLAGLPDSYVERLRPGERDGTYRVSLDYPEINPFMEQAQDRDLRRELFRKNWNKAVAVNRPLLEEALELRRRIAALLGHPTWAHYAMEVKMAAAPERVAAFYDQLVPPLAGRPPRAGSARAGAARRGRDDRSPPGTGASTTRARRTEYGVDQNQVSEYLPLDRGAGRHVRADRRRVRAGLPSASRTRSAWHPSVQLFEIRDTAPRRVIAHFYADLFPREGKFTHAAAFPLVIGHRAATAATSSRSTPSSRTSRRRRAPRRRCSRTARSRRSSTSSATSCT